MAEREPLVLVAEDECVISMSLVDQLEESGFRAIAVGDCDSALSAVSTCTFDAAVLDVRLRGRSCRDVVAVLLAKGVPYVFLSGYAPQTSGLPIHLRAAAVWLTKPSGEGQVVGEIARIIRRKYANGALGPTLPS